VTKGKLIFFYNTAVPPGTAFFYAIFPEENVTHPLLDKYPSSPKNAPYGEE
jgi:hypothetical protein